MSSSMKIMLKHLNTAIKQGKDLKTVRNCRDLLVNLTHPRNPQYRDKDKCSALLQTLASISSVSFRDRKLHPVLSNTEDKQST